LARLLPLEHPLGVAGEFENLDALVHVGLVSFLMTRDLALQAAL
jgi:hypothetical protein